MPTPRTLVVGTGNKHKAQEIAPLLAGLPIELKAAGGYGHFDPEENGSSLEENAIIKARAALGLSGEWSIADDTGLFVDALDGRPGIFAARYAGEGCSFADNIHMLLGELKGIPPERRGATFSCCIAFCRPGAEPLTFRGDLRGRIETSPRGIGGFGYDPVFVVEEIGKTFAELTADEKNGVSHRARAVKAFRAFLEKQL